MNISKNKETKISKSLSYWLRHEPEDIGLNMDSNGWVGVKELIENAKSNMLFDFNELKYVVDKNGKQRFAFDRDLCRIRANQGHSNELCERIGIKIDSQVKIMPPEILYHGTKINSVDAIKESGLTKMSRQHVHLSIDEDTAQIVAGRRKGDYTILKIKAKKLHHAGHDVLISENGVYLTDVVPVEFIIFD